MKKDAKQIAEEIYHQRLVVRAYRSDAENPGRLLREAERLEKLAEESLQRAAQLRERSVTVKEDYVAACSKLEELVKTERLLRDKEVQELLRLQRKLQREQKRKGGKK